MKRIAFVLVVAAGFVAAKEILPEDVIPGEVVFKLAPETELIRARTTITGLTAVDRELARFQVRSVEPLLRTRARGGPDLPDINRIYLGRFDAVVNPRVVAQALENQPGVVYAEPRFIRRIFDEPDDPRFGEQWHLSKIVVSQAWDLSHGDSTVIVAVVDNGFDMDHPDLEANYYTNPGEIPGNGVDDDGNGYIDDVHGWDFAGNDNDPNHGPDAGLWRHGTHVAGVANAVTDNKEGVAGVAWNVRTLPIKASYDDEPFFVDFGYDGIVYAANLGAHIINCSWGGAGFSKAEAEIIETASRMGSLVVGAAGNAASSEHHYPSAYEGVLSVAATNSTDARASFSNFGLSVDVSAPGVGVLATFPEGGYGSISGTSMSAPVTAGLLGLIKSHYPDLTAKELAFRAAGSADNIDGANPSHVGMLGSGRVNAFQALDFTDQEFVDIPSRIELWEFSVTDSVGGDSNSWFDRGETIHVSTVYWNHSLGGATQVTINLSEDDPDITVINGSTSPASFPPDTTLRQSHELSFLISETASGHRADVALDLKVDGELHTSDTLTFGIGKMPVLVVNDGGNDGGGGGSTSQANGFYTGILDELNILYAVWDHELQGSPSEDVLGNFPTVIWFTEWHFPSLDGDDRDALRGYLEGGGNLYISGQDLGWDLNENPGTEDQKSFYSDYLHALWGGDHSGSMAVEGVFGDPIGHDLSFDVYQPGIELDYQYPDWFTPDSDANLIFRYDNGKGMGLRYDNGYRLVYTGVGLEALGSEENSTPPGDINDIQRTVLSRILSYLNFIHHQPLTDTESTETNFQVAAKVTTDLSDLVGVTLYYRDDTMSDFATVSMSDNGQGEFEGTIPAPMTDTYISYYIEFKNSYYRWSNPASAPGSTFQFYAGPDTVVPVLTFVSQLEDRIDRSGPDTVRAFAMDNIGVGDITLEYTVDTPTTSESFTVPMVFTGELWEGEIEWFGVPGNTLITYQVTVKDTSSNENVTQSDPMTFKILNWARITAWENKSLSGWNTGDSWTLYSIGPPYGWGVHSNAPETKYPPNASNTLTLLNPIDLAEYASAYLSFWTGFDLEADKDFGHIEISGDGSNWQTHIRLTGMFQEKDILIDIGDFISNGEAYLRFRLTSDDSVEAWGWAIDDVYLLVDTTIAGPAVEPVAELPSRFALQQNYPNPFNPVTAISFSLPHSADVRLVVYDLLGREVERLLVQTMPAGTHRLMWNADHHPSGVYLYRLEAGNFVETRKLVLVK